MSEFTKGKWKYLEKLQEVIAYPEGPGEWNYLGGMPSYPDEQAFWKDITGELRLNDKDGKAENRGLVEVQVC